ncbi:MAG: sensor histidine kinase [Bernardetiaceae bacterium]
MNKNQRLYALIGIAAFSLLGLVAVQVHWIQTGVQLKEAQFDHRVNMALHQVGRELARRLPSCSELRQGLAVETVCADLPAPDYALLDSLLMAQFAYRHIEADYQFFVVNRTLEKTQVPVLNTDWQQTPYRGCLDSVLEAKGWDLRICFPNKEEVIWAGLAGMLVLSVVFIGLVIGCFALTIYTILRQKKLSQMTTDFINNMTHELKTPIATVSLASRMLQREKVLQMPEKITHYARIIEQENTKLTEQVEQVLQMARLERGQLRIQPERLDLHAVLVQAIEVMNLQVQSRGGYIHFYPEATSQKIQADPMHLRNIFLNLLDNANKYSPEAPQITARTRNTSSGIEVQISDQGIGMSKDKQKHAFEKFYRAHTGNIHDVKGFGLGLAYVKLMTEAHNGTVRLQSEAGVGTTFTLFFPFDEQTQPDMPL